MNETIQVTCLCAHRRHGAARHTDRHEQQSGKQMAQGEERIIPVVRTIIIKCIILYNKWERLILVYSEAA